MHIASLVIKKNMNQLGVNILNFGWKKKRMIQKLLIGSKQIQNLVQVARNLSRRIKDVCI